WYTFTPTCEGVVEVNTCAATGFDTKLGVFTGPCTALTCVAGNDDSACTFSGLRSSVTFNAIANTTYYIYVTGFGTGSGPFQLNLIYTQDICCAMNPLFAEFQPTDITVCPYEPFTGSLIITGGVPGPA